MTNQALATIQTTTDEIRGTVHKCLECGRWEKVSKGGVIVHSKHCDTKAQAVEIASPRATDDNQLRTFARDVRRTATTKGRDEDTVNAVRSGFLSVSDAMNTDD